MISLENTPNYAGVQLTGNQKDFEGLYDAIHAIIGDEGEYFGYEEVRIRVLVFCDELRHAMNGERGVVFIPNGLQQAKMKGGISITALQEKNAYYQFQTLWPELLFIGFVLNDFIELSAKHKTHFWDIIPATVRQFQAVIGECLEKTVGEKKFRLLKPSLTPTFIGYYQNYILQYIDHLNIELLKMSKEKRYSCISITAKRVANKDKNYISIKRKVENTAMIERVSPSEVILPDAYPDKIIW